MKDIEPPLKLPKYRRIRDYKDDGATGSGQSDSRTDVASDNVKSPRKLPKEYESLVSLIHDKDKMLDALFDAIHNYSLLGLVPKGLQVYITDRKEELKRLCREELKTLPDDLIIHILQGKDVADYVKKPQSPKPKSPSPDKEANVSESEVPTSSTLKRKYPSESDGELEDFSDSKRSTTLKDDDEESPSMKADSEPLMELYPSSNEMESMDPDPNKGESPTGESNDDADLELLELEMRARAIRSLLKSKNS